jgi:hypothetical protein
MMGRLSLLEVRMRRPVLALTLLAATAVAPSVVAKFGISKTKVVLPRVRPPETPLLAETVSVDVRSASPEVSGSYVSLVRGRLEEALRAGDLYRTVERSKADASLRVTLDNLRAEVRDEIRMEKKYVKIGERQEWNDKKKKMETKDVYGDREEPVSWRIADGSLSASVEVDGPDGPRSTDTGGSYHDQFKTSERIPPEAATEESLRRFLVQQAADRAAAAVTFSPDPVEALLAVNGELKDGNRLAEQGLFEQALEAWGGRTYKGDTEAARLHNVGVGHEALAYKFPPYTPEHRSHLEQARELYRKAQALDPDEKYFRDPPVRIEVSLQYAANAALFMSELEQYREEKSARAQRPSAAKARTAGGAGPGAPQPGSAATPAAGAGPLRNGSFESSLSPWGVTGKGTVVQEPGRGKVLEAVPAATAGVAVKQAVGVDLGAKGGASLSLDYRVTAGEAQIRANVTYMDSNGRQRNSTLEVTAGEGPGAWSSWTGDLGALRPHPASIKEIKLVVEGGTARLDNVALTPK